MEVTKGILMLFFFSLLKERVFKSPGGRNRNECIEPCPCDCWCYLNTSERAEESSTCELQLRREMIKHFSMRWLSFVPTGTPQAARSS